MIKINLKNGVRGVIVPLKGLNSVSLEVFVKMGAKYEDKTEAGLSHFLEHMAFKGTRKRPEATDMFRELDSRGANFGAETDYESTAYHITTVRENLSWSAEMLSDMLFNSLMAGDEVKKERGVIIEEIKMYKDNPMMGLDFELVKLMYGKSNLGCWDVSGEIKDIEGVSREQLLNYRKRYFNPHNVVVVATGNVKEEDMKLIEEYFGEDWGDEAIKLPKVEINLNPEKIFTSKRKVEQAHFGVAVPTFGSDDKRKYAAKLLELILAGTTSSKLFEEIRSKRGWAYYVFPIGQSLKEGGFWGVQAGVAQEQLSEAVELVKEVILSIDKWIKPEDLERAKQYIRGKLTLMFDQSDFWADYVGERMLQDDDEIDPRVELKKLEEVELKEIQDIVKEFFKAENLREYRISG